MDLSNNLSTLFRNVSYTLSSNIISLIISICTILLLPKFIDVESYSYWQLYMFYGTFIGFLHFGWNDGVYLRYGGQSYGALNMMLMSSQFRLLSYVQILFSFVIIIYSYYYVSDENKIVVIVLTAVTLIFTNVRYYLLYILQATNRMKEYAFVTIIEKVLIVLWIFCILCFKVESFKVLIFGDIIGKIISLLVAILFCKEIVFSRTTTFKIAFLEAKKNIAVGINMMFSNIASKLMSGNIKFAIENVWSVIVFGKISLMLSLSAFMMVFINAVSLVLFPFLRRLTSTQLYKTLLIIRWPLGVFLLSVMILYFPVYKFVEFWLPQYKDSLVYLSILFPMCVFEGKMALLINTYLKVLRLEKKLLLVNVISLIISLIITYVTVYLLENINYAVMSILIILSIRSILSEIVLYIKMGIKINFYIFLESIVVFVFILLVKNFDFMIALYVYTIIIVLIILFSFNKIKSLVNVIKSNMY